MFSIIFSYELKVENDMLHNRLECFRDGIVNVMRVFNSPKLASQPACFRGTHKQKFQGFKSRDRGGQAVGKWRLKILPLTKCRFISYFTGIVIPRGEPSSKRFAYFRVVAMLKWAGYAKQIHNLSHWLYSWQNPKDNLLEKKKTTDKCGTRSKQWLLQNDDVLDAFWMYSLLPLFRN